MRRFFVRDKGIAKQFQRTKNVGGVSVGGVADLANGTPRALARAHTILLHDDFFTPQDKSPLYMDVQRRGVNILLLLLIIFFTPYFQK